MVNEWCERSLAELTDNFDSVRIPVKEADRRAGPYPYYGASGIVDYIDNYLFDGEYLLIAEDGENLRTRNTPIGFLAQGKFWVNNHAHIIRGNDEADTRFLMYAIAATDISGYLTGSTMPKLTQTNMNRIPIMTPPLPKQRAIANILGILDDKIELNGRISETLEAMARALFKSWFVDFDPVRAKAEGRDPGLPKPITDLFPDRFKYSEKVGEIPAGWEAGNFSNIISRRLERVGNREAIVLSAITSGQLIRSDEQFTKRVYSKEIDRYLAVEQWDFAYNPSRINIGSIGMLEEPIIGAVSPAYIVVRPAPTYRWFLEFYLRRPLTKEWINTLASGSVRQALSYRDFALIPCVIPPEKLIQKWDIIWTELRHGILARLSENNALAALRDTLLPKLVSGELRIKDSERFIGRSV